MGLIGNVKVLPSRQHGWKPFTLSRITLVFGVAVSIGLITILGVLLWQNSRNGSIFLADAKDGFTSIQIFLFRYLPTIVSVFYGLFWSWLDLDIKRLEPYYQLARPGGALMRDSLALGYTNAFFAIVPYTSAKASHWTVFAISLLTILVNWTVTPLQNGIFVSRMVRINETVLVSQPYSLASLESQSRSVSSKFLLDTSSVLWLGQELPSFTTRDFTLAPVQLVKPVVGGSNRTLSITTTLYESELTCHQPANISIISSSLMFDDGNGCATSPGIPATVFPAGSLEKADFNFSTYYVGYSNDPRVSWIMEGESCPSTNSHKIIIMWRRSSSFPSNFSDPNNATAVFCQPSYHYQNVQATVSLPDLTVQQVERVGPRNIIADAHFNRSVYESITNIGASEFNAESQVVGNSILRQDSFVANMSLEPPVETMTGLAIGATHLSSEQYLNSTNLIQAYQSAYRMAFAHAIRSLMQPPENIKLSATQSSASYQAITTVSVFLILAQIALAFITFLAVYLLVQSPKRSSHLKRDPDCVAENMILSRKSAVRKYVHDYYANDDQIPYCTEDSVFSIELDDALNYPSLRMSEIEPCNKHNIPGSGFQVEARDSYIEPIQYKWYVGVAFVSLLAGLLFGLIALAAKCSKENGLTLPSSNDIVLQIVTNVIPTLLATAIEPIWIWLSRMACVLAPLDNLQQRLQPSKHSLSLKYAAVPPQFAAWQALRAGNYVVGITSWVAFTAGVLTVVISGLFITLEVEVPTAPTYLPRLYTNQLLDDPIGGSLDVNDRSKALFVALPNVGNQAPLPTWTTPDQFFLPLNLSTLDDYADTKSVNLSLQGFSVLPQCVELTSSDVRAANTYDLSFNNNATVLNLTTSHALENGTHYNCGYVTRLSIAGREILPYGPGLASLEPIQGDPRGRKALQLGIMGNAYRADLGGDFFELPDHGRCRKTLIFGWIRSEFDFVQDGNVTELGVMVKSNVSSTLMACTPKFVSGIYNVTIDPRGSILSTTPIANVSSESLLSANFSRILQDTINFYPSGGTETLLEWRNDSVPLTTSNVLQSQLTNSTLFLDPYEEPPQISDQIPIVGELFTRIFILTMRLSLNRFATASPDEIPALAIAIRNERRIFLSSISFYLAVGLLSLQLVVAIIFFLTRPRPFLKRLPVTLAAQISMFANSHIVDDVVKDARASFKELDHRGWMYGYGKFVGLDGTVDEGIERAPYVTAIQARPSGFQRSMGQLLRRKPAIDTVQHGTSGVSIVPTVSTPLMSKENFNSVPVPRFDTIPTRNIRETNIPMSLTTQDRAGWI